ncbi:SET domain-containing protein [Parasegetibacter sp. NRK P23]|uniref:SET domain-containing protein n=1 Tax=Parasegetibacter sp. NRK P23 TaxID=2942999 RepID=UPI002043ACBE|nr:SET domain-containing protein [Parasegetibacter sp. NRK P23]MCM5528832.1 SET domain-containing protein [Parasegetibacter sp. NRK P23]
MILPCLYIAPTPSMDRGVFTAEALEAGTVIEISPVIVMNSDHRKLLDQTPLHDYIFEWGENLDECVVALGYLSMYNHAYHSNCDYDMDYEGRTMQIRTVRDIAAGEELFINYNGAWNETEPVWFDAQ